MINRIIINDYQQILCKDDNTNEILKQSLPLIIKNSLINLNANIVDVYNMPGISTNHSAGTKDRICIFINECFKHSNNNYKTELESPKPINNIANNFTHFLKPINTDDTIIILSEHDIPLAEWRDTTFELDILFNLFDSPENLAAKTEIFKYIMTEFDRLVWLPKVKENSWIQTSNKDKLIAEMKDVFIKQRESLLKNEKTQIVDLENRISAYKREISNYCKTLFQKRRIIMQEENNIENISDNILKDLDTIVNNKKIKDITFNNGIFSVYTNPLYIHDKDKTYYGGNYIINIDMNNTDIRFKGDNCRKSYWTYIDPHPHVNGANGEACLGNISSTIAELCAQYQLYALITICIDFLESVNTEDVAGANVIYWDEVDKDGNIIPKEKKEYKICEHCDKEVEQLYDAYEYVEANEDGVLQAMNIRQICIECRDNDYHFDDDVQQYIMY